MPEGTLHVELSGLEEALAAVRELLGAAAEGEVPGHGLLGAAGVAEGSPLTAIGAAEGRIEGSLGGVLELDGAASVGAGAGAFADLEATVEISPDAALAGLLGRLGSAGEAVSAVAAVLDDLVAAVEGVAGEVPENRFGALAPLLRQLLGALEGLEGPEAEAIATWLRALEGQRRGLEAALADLEAGADPGDLALRLFEGALGEVLDLLGFRRVRALRDLVLGLPDNFVPAELQAALTDAAGAAEARFGELRGVAGGDFDGFRAAGAAVHGALIDLREAALEVLCVVRQVSRFPLFAPGGLETFLRRRMERALAIEVRELQRIDDPYGALLDRIDEAVAGIDLSAARDQVLELFAGLRRTLEAIDLPSLPSLAEERLAALDDAVAGVRDAVSDARREVEGFLGGVAERQRAAAAGLGTFQPDGSFRFHLERELTERLEAARSALTGQAAPAIAEVQAAVGDFLATLEALLEPVEEAIDGVVPPAVEAIRGFAESLRGLDLPALLEEARAQVEAAVEALTPLDFAVVVDPVVQVLDENAETLGEIDPESLDDLLRAALAAALDGVVSVDFSAEISAPLGERFAAVRAVPEGLLDELQAGYEQALARLQELSPEERLLEPLAAATRTIREALEGIDLEAVVARLDRPFEEAVLAPLEALRPSALLEPLIEAHGRLAAAAGELRGEVLLAPVAAALDRLREEAAAVDPVAPLDRVAAAVATVQSRLEALRPSELLGPVTEELRRVEEALDRFRPSVVFAPVADLAAPLLAVLEEVQEETVQALFELFQAPLEVLDDLRPERAAALVRDGIGRLLALLRTLDLPGRVSRLQAAHFDLVADLRTDGAEVRLGLAGRIDPALHLGELLEVYREGVAALEGLRDGLELPDLDELYDELRERLLGLLPPFARELLDVETFRRVLRLADPTRFLEELDRRFEEIRARLLPVQPEELAAELDAAHAELVALVAELDLTPVLDAIRERLTALRSAVAELRVDFLAQGLDEALGSLREVVAALDPSPIGDRLDGLQAEVTELAGGLRPAALLADLPAALDRVQGLVDRVDPEATLGPPLREAWAEVGALLEQVDLTVILAPIVDRLAELEAEFVLGLERTEDAFDRMLGAARGALGGGGAVSASVGGSIG